MTPRLPRIVFALALAGTILGALLPNAQAPDLGGGDKVNHIVAFATLSVLAAWAWPRAAMARIALWLAALGGLIEAAQAMPMIARDAEWADWGADMAAVSIALAIVWLLRRILRRL